MSADTTTIALPVPAGEKLARYWQTAKTAAGTCVIILAIIGFHTVTEPLRADASVVQPAKAKAVRSAPGK